MKKAYHNFSMGEIQGFPYNRIAISKGWKEKLCLIAK
jgi:hypothetical protein